MAARVCSGVQVVSCEVRESAAAIRRYFAEALPLHVADEDVVGSALRKDEAEAALGGGNTGRNTTIIRSNYLWEESAEDALSMKGLGPQTDWSLGGMDWATEWGMGRG